MIRTIKKFYIENKIFTLYLGLYLLISQSFLTRFPFVHSDEPWLSGLSQKIALTKNFAVTESFFDFYPRQPHAIKIIFQGIQSVFISLFGHSIYSMRIISLLFAIMALFLFYIALKRITSKKISIIATILLSLDIQYIYSSHFARQEIVLVFLFTLALFFMLLYESTPLKQTLVTGVVIGLSIGIHPNSFVIAIPFGLIFLYKSLLDKSSLKYLLIYGLILLSFAFFFVALSFSFNPNFVSDYFNYGKEFGVDHAPLSKFTQLKGFLLKLYHGVSGTYYTPNIKFQLIIYPILILFSVYQTFFKYNKKFIYPVLSFVGILFGTIIIGRYNQTSVVFLFIPLYYILAISFELISTHFKSNLFKSTVSIYALILIIMAILNINPFLSVSYDGYLAEISKYIKSDQHVLANLNTAYYFEEGVLYDYRNLTFIKEKNTTFDDYIAERKIEYIIYSTEMDFIYNTRPLWNGLYGNLYYYYDDMQLFFDNDCELVHSFTNPYGMRIARYFFTKETEVKIYKVLKP